MVYDNIKKSISYLFSGNLGAIIAIVFALVVGWVNPFTALQLLFINLVNDSVPAIALGMEKAEPDVMENGRVVKLYKARQKVTAIKTYLFVVKPSFKIFCEFERAAKVCKVRAKIKVVKAIVFANGLMRVILIRGSLIGIAAIISQYVGQKTSPEMGVAMAFTTLIYD